MMALLSDVLQTSIYTRLAAAPDLGAVIGSHLYDAVPAGPVPDLYVLIGEEAVRDASDQGAHGAVHDVSIAAISTADSFLKLKQAAAAIISALEAPELALSRGRVVGIWFKTSVAKRNASGQRRIELKFRVRVEA